MNVPPPTDFAARRMRQLTSAPPKLAEAWRRSQQTYHDFDLRLASADLHPAVVAAYFVGSLGRMEQVDGSDADLIVLVADGFDLDSPAAQLARDSVWRHLVPVGLPPPKPTGIYAQADSSARLRDTRSRGLIDEDLGVFGRRFQMLLEGQPVCGSDVFRRLQAAIVARYMSGNERINPRASYNYLLHDLIRYYRSLCIRTQWIDDPGEWRLINAKLLHSRRLAYAGLLLLLGAASRETAAAEWLAPRLWWTPLERVAAVFEMYDDHRFSEIAAAYSQFLAKLSDVDFRRTLTSSTDASRNSAAYREMTDNATVIVRVLQQFLQNRMTDWPDEFWAALLL